MRIRQSLDGVLLRIFNAKKMSDITPHKPELKQLLVHYTMAKRHFKQNDMQFVADFFDYYTTKDDGE